MFSADTTDALRAAALQVMTIEDTTFGDEQKGYTVRFRGRLTLDSIEAYARVSKTFHALGYTTLFRKDTATQLDAVLAVKGVIDPAPSRVWINGLMFALTILSVTYTGASYASSEAFPTTLSAWLSGVPFLFSMLGILLAHELGHYFAARYHQVKVTLPYFIPLPFLSPFGTLGAFIQLKSPPTNRRVLLDIGIAGPLAGLVVAVPVLIYGLLTSHIEPLPTTLPPGTGLSLEGNSILYVFLKWLVFGRWLPEPASFGNLPPMLYMLRYYLLGFPLPLGGADVLLNNIAWAGWGGLLVTGLNLIPVGQLDGGHTLYVLIGQRANRVMPFIVGVLLVLGFFWYGWFLWAALIYFWVGRMHAEPLDQITELDLPRRVLAVLVLIIFVLVFTPIPLNLVAAGG